MVALGKWGMMAGLVVAGLLLAAWLGSEPAGAQTGAPVELQPLVNRAASGETIVLQPGLYAGPIVIDKPLTIRAEREGAAMLRNSSLQPAVLIEADGVTLEGLTIDDAGVKEAASVLVQGSRTVLSRLHIRTGAHGIAVRNASDGVVTDSTMEWAAPGVSMADKGNGIDLYESHRWKLSGNIIREVHDGIYMENSDDIEVAHNVIELSRYGIHCMYTKRTIIRHNESRRNVTGAMVMTAREVTMEWNVFAKQSENAHSQGILLYDAHQSAVIYNTVEGNRVGLYVEQSGDNRLEHNEVSYNFVGLQLLESNGNVVFGNRFVGNVADAQSRGSSNNTISANYWDSFRGIDTDGDGRSDVAYAINPFFQGLTQRRPAFQLFFQSPGMVFLEGLYHSGREQWATDTAPLMAPGMLEADARDPGGSGAAAAGALLLAGAGMLIYTMRR